MSGPHAGAASPDAAALLACIDEWLDAAHFAVGESGVVRPSARGVARVGLALEPGPRLAAWTHAQRLDALFLHRPWRLDAATLPAHVGVIFAHRPFDERLTVGYNVRLAAALSLRGPVPFAARDGRPLGMLADIDAAATSALIEHVRVAFGGSEAVAPGAADHVSRVALVGAMTDALVREAHTRGAGLYVTGQWRAAGEAAARDTGIAVVAVGHARAERWGLAALGRLLRERWPAMHVALAPD